MDNTSYRKGSFPAQKLPLSKKTKKWFEDCVLEAEKMSFVNDHRIRQSMRNKRINYDLANDILDMEDVARATNPYNIEGLTAPAKFQNHGVSMAKIDLLHGEEIKRRFDYFIRITNPDAISTKEQQLRKLIDESMVNILSQMQERPDYSEEDFRRSMEQINKFKNYTYQDLRERRATQLLKYLERKERLREKFSRSFLDLLIAGEELACIDIIAGEPIMRRLNPLEVYAVSNGDSPYLEDADIIIEDSYHPPGKVIDMFHDELKESDVQRILDGDLTDSGSSRFSMGEREMSIIPTAQFELAVDPDTGQMIDSTPNDRDGYRGAFDLDGNVRVMRVVWRGVIPIYKVKYFNQETGEIEEDIMPEGYKKDGTEISVKKVWISNWYEGTMIGSGKDSIIIKTMSRPIQFREMDNPSKCYSGYVGSYMNVNDSRSYSLMDRMRPLQYLYNVYMYRTEQAFAKSYGKILQLPMHMVPDNWELDKWLNYLFTMNIMVTDAFKEGDRGAAQGKIAGTLNQGQLVADMEQGNYIQQNIMMLEFIKREMGEIVGITEQRQGQIQTRELVGNVQRAVSQSSHITEKWFQMHDDFKRRCLTMLLETAKFAYKGRKEKKQLILDDLTSQIFEVDGDELMECDHGLFVSNSTQDTELYDSLKNLSMMALQSGELKFTQLIDIYMADSMVDIKRKIENAENLKSEQEMDMQREQIQAQKEAAQMAAQMEQAKLDVSEQNNIRDNQTKLLIEQMKEIAEQMASENENGDNDDEKLNLELKKHIDQMDLKMKELKMKDAQHNDKIAIEKQKIKKMSTAKSSK